MMARRLAQATDAGRLDHERVDRARVEQHARRSEVSHRLVGRDRHRPGPAQPGQRLGSSARWDGLLGILDVVAARPPRARPRPSSAPRLPLKSSRSATSGPTASRTARDARLERAIGLVPGFQLEAAEAGLDQVLPPGRAVSSAASMPSMALTATSARGLAVEVARDGLRAGPAPAGPPAPTRPRSVRPGRRRASRRSSRSVPSTLTGSAQLDAGEHLDEPRRDVLPQVVRARRGELAQALAAVVGAQDDDAGTVLLPALGAADDGLAEGHVEDLDLDPGDAHQAIPGTARPIAKSSAEDERQPRRLTQHRVEPPWVAAHVDHAEERHRQGQAGQRQERRPGVTSPAMSSATGTA